MNPTGNDCLIAVSVKVEDVICCLSGKIRCRKVTTIGEIKDRDKPNRSTTTQARANELEE